MVNLIRKAANDLVERIKQDKHWEGNMQVDISYKYHFKQKSIIIFMTLIIFTKKHAKKFFLLAYKYHCNFFLFF